VRPMNREELLARTMRSLATRGDSKAKRGGVKSARVKG